MTNNMYLLPNKPCNAAFLEDYVQLMLTYSKIRELYTVEGSQIIWEREFLYP